MAAPTPEQIEKLLNGPSLAPPRGVVPNFVDPDNFHVWFIVTAVVCLTFSTLALAMRIYTKMFITRRTEWEDCKFGHLNDHEQAWLILPRYCSPRMGRLLVRARNIDIDLIFPDHVCRQYCFGWYADQIWGWGSSMGYTAKKRKPSAICMLPSQIWLELGAHSLWPSAVHEYSVDSVRHHSIDRENLNPPTVPEDLCSNTESQFDVRRLSHGHLDHHSFLSLLYLFRNFHLLSKAEVLDPNNDNRSLLRRNKTQYRRRSVQCSFGLGHPSASPKYHLEASDAL